MRKLPLMLMFVASAALAADRHVLLDTDGNGVLNTCPNPVHNATLTAGNTSNMTYCATGADAGKVIGTHTGYVTSCAGGVTPSNVTNGISADIDGDGTNEVIYGHPQACVYNMAKSDSCEVHAGTYTKPGAQCTANCGNASDGTTCYDWNCFLATVVAFGFGPNLTGTGYGTAGSPGYLRGAVMNGSTDSWDPNSDKNPADASYSAILSGDSNRGSGTVGVFDQTSCSGTSCSGDTFAGVWVGCGGTYPTGYAQFNCPRDSDITGNEERVMVDTDANGSFETAIGAGSSAPPVDHFIIKDVVFTGYNQGNGATNPGGRYREAIINLNGNGASTGFKVDHIYMHDNSFGVAGSVTAEMFWAAIADMRNKECLGYTEVKNSLIHQNNKFIFNEDGHTSPSTGCSWLIHDNRFWIEVKGSEPSPAIGYWKNLDYHTVDGRIKQVRFFNNEVIYRDTDSGANDGWFADLQHFGNGGGQGKGEFWVYGNIFRNDPSNVHKADLFMPHFCSDGEANGTESWRFYYFNNTWDGWSSGKSVELGYVCNSTASTGQHGELYVGKNNVEVFTSAEQVTDNVDTTKISNNVSTDARRCADSGGANTRYFDCGANPTAYTGLTYYAPKANGGLVGTGTCDPDGDGLAGVDYDGNGSNDTTWTDIAGNSVNCPTTGTAMEIGAIQLGGGPTQVCGNNVREGTEICDGTDVGTDSCVARGFAGGTLTCNDCLTITTELCTLAGVPRSILQGVKLQGGVIR